MCFPAITTRGSTSWRYEWKPRATGFPPISGAPTGKGRKRCSGEERRQSVPCGVLQGNCDRGEKDDEERTRLFALATLCSMLIKWTAGWTRSRWRRSCRRCQWIPSSGLRPLLRRPGHGLLTAEAGPFSAPPRTPSSCPRVPPSPVCRPPPHGNILFHALS
jgi:hypothetical protein